jgi:hypothetical protein
MAGVLRLVLWSGAWRGRPPAPAARAVHTAGASAEALLTAVEGPIAPRRRTAHAERLRRQQAALRVASATDHAPPPSHHSPSSSPLLSSSSVRSKLQLVATPSRVDADAEFDAHFARDPRLAALPQRVARAIWRRHRREPRPAGTSAVASMQWAPWVARWTALTAHERARDAAGAVALVQGWLDRHVAIPTAFYSVVLDVRARVDPQRHTHTQCVCARGRESVCACV